MDFSSLPFIKIQGQPLDQLQKFNTYKGKFVVSNQGHLLVKIVAQPIWDEHPFFHKEILSDLGIKDPLSDEVRLFIQGGGYITVTFIENHLEVFLYGKSTDYGTYDPSKINIRLLAQQLALHFDFPEELIHFRLQD